MSNYHRDDSVSFDGQWYSRMFINPDCSEVAEIVSSPEGLRVYVPNDVPLNREAVRRLRTALARYERWLDANPERIT